VAVFFTIILMGALAICEDNYASYQDRELFDETTVIPIKHRYMLSDTMYNFYLRREFLLHLMTENTFIQFRDSEGFYLWHLQ